MKKIVLAFVFLFSFCGVAFANPAPFGFELGKATFKEVTKKYPKYEIVGELSFLREKVIYIEANEFDLEGVETSVSMHFDDKGILTCCKF